jgi:signal transduction histidine kinase
MNLEEKGLLVDFLKSFIRSIVYSNLYSSDHPQVKSQCSESINKLNLFLDKINSNKIEMSFYNGKFFVNSEFIMSSEKMPQTLINLYTKTHITSFEIYRSVEVKEIIIFSKILSLKVDPQKYLEENGIKNIKISKEKYIRANEAKKEDATQNQINLDDISSTDFVESLRIIVSKVVDDKNIQDAIIAKLMEKFKEEVQKAIDNAIREIKLEKNKIENDYIRVESVFSNITGSEIIIDKNGNVIMATPDASKLTGKDLKEIAGKKLLDIAEPDKEFINISEEIKSISDKKIEPKIITKGREDVVDTIKKSTAVIKNEDGKIVGTILIPPEIAKLKEVEQLKSDFISTMTHELRSPLTSIKMALDIISRENITNPQTKIMLNTAIRNTERLNSLINDILDFSKLQSGKMIFNLDNYSPYEIAKNAVEAMSAWAKSKNINLTLEADENLPNIYVDKKRTEQILINLLSNALKFTPENGKITVSINNSLEKPGYVCFSVKDTGCGIKKEDQEKIFEKFVQLASGKAVGGTGLGLAITKAMVVMQQGSITLESEEGKGSTFKVYMPIYKGQGRIEISESQKEKEEKKPWWKRILGI